MGPEGEQERRDEVATKLGVLLENMGWREEEGKMTRNDLLDRPILRVLIQVLGSGLGAQLITSSSTLDYADL